MALTTLPGCLCQFASGNYSASLVVCSITKGTGARAQAKQLERSGRRNILLTLILSCVSQMLLLSPSEISLSLNILTKAAFHFLPPVASAALCATSEVEYSGGTGVRVGQLELNRTRSLDCFKWQETLGSTRASGSAGIRCSDSRKYFLSTISDKGVCLLAVFHFAVGAESSKYRYCCRFYLCRQ